MKRSPYLYDIENCIIYKRPHFTSEQAQIQASLALCKHGYLFGIWSPTLTEGKKRGNTIADRLPYKARDILAEEGFAGTGITW